MATEYEERKRITFEQAEGVAPLPTQLALKEISPELRSLLWRILYIRMHNSKERGNFARDRLAEPWRGILSAKHVERDFKPADEFDERFEVCVNSVKEVILEGDYAAVLGFVQWLLRRQALWRDRSFFESIAGALQSSRAAYAIFDRDTIIPISSDAEAETLRQAFVDVASAEFRGARSHLREAGSNLTEGDYGASVKESIHAVEAVARVLAPNDDKLGSALAKLTKSIHIHPSLAQGFKNLYGYASDEQGIRHPLVDASSAQVDEVDALYMLGSCAAFVSYLINKARNAGLI